HGLGEIREQQREPEPGGDRPDEPGRRFAPPDQGLEPEPRGEDAAHQHREHHGITHLVPRVELAERVADRPAQHGAVEPALRSGGHRTPPTTRCSTIGPSASAGKNVSAPTIRTTETTNPTKSGVCVGSVPEPGGILFLAASAPARARMGTISA